MNTEQQDQTQRFIIPEQAIRYAEGAGFTVKDVKQGTIAFRDDMPGVEFRLRSESPRGHRHSFYWQRRGF